MNLFRESKQAQHTRAQEEARLARRLSLHADTRPLGDDRSARALVAWVFGTVAIAIVWAAMTPVTETVTGEGRILPVGGDRPAQTLDGGLVASVFVEEGAFVTAGETLVIFDRTEQSAALRRLEARNAGREAEHARWKAVADDRSFKAPDTAAGREQTKAYVADKALDAATIKRLSATATAAARQIAFSVSRITALKEELDLAKSTEERAKKLVSSGSMSERAYEEAARARLRVAQDLAEAESAEAQARVAAADAELAVARHVADRRARAAERVAALAVELTELNEEIARVREQVRRDRVIAPVDGRIQDLTVRDPGQTVPAGATVARIVPDGGELFAEMRVNADRVGDVSEGLTASIKVLAYDFARFGAISGEVVSVSPTSDVDEAGRVFFRVRLRLLETVGGIDVRPGLSVTADLETGQKTVLEYFAKPLRILRDRALSEA